MMKPRLAREIDNARLDKFEKLGIEVVQQELANGKCIDFNFHWFDDATVWLKYKREQAEWDRQLERKQDNAKSNFALIFSIVSIVIALIVLYLQVQQQS
jgi:hypothetical protein